MRWWEQVLFMMAPLPQISIGGVAPRYTTKKRKRKKRKRKKRKSIKKKKMNPLQNQYPTASKRFFLQLLSQNIAGKHWRIIEKICESIINDEGDYKQLGALVAQIYESGYLCALNQHKEALASVGLEATIVPPPKKPNSIFK